MSAVIRAESLSKRYRLQTAAQPRRSDTLRDAIASGMSSLRRGREKSLDFWALDDVSFEVKQGERIGIIGRNGAGKSTLLKLLSQITEPTRGRIRIKGRLASLLEVGTGFHPELSGRENIYLNGAILGMRRAEIRRKFDEIVEFAEVEQFLETPVKRYSSGMYVRLAFAVAAHLEPDILVVDEVLSVGDARFQKKCLGKMEDVSSREGRTVLVVSHQLPMIRNLCTRCLLLEKGKLAAEGEPGRVIARYLESSIAGSTEWRSDEKGQILAGGPYFVLKRFALVDAAGHPIASPMSGVLPEAFVEIEGYVEHADPRLNLGFALSDEDDNQLFMSFQTDQSEAAWPKTAQGPVKIRAPIDLSILSEGQYRLTFLAGLHCIKMWSSYEEPQIVLQFEIQGNRSGSPYWITRRPALLAPVLRWESV
jgi:lipopolysaccharide transport system ATP-binding protein